MVPAWGDQASGLRRLFSRPAVRVVAFVAGSPDVGRTVAVANLAAVLAQQGKEVLLVDENTVDNTAAFFGHGPVADLQEAIDRRCSLSDIVVTVAPRIRLLPAAIAVRRLATLGYRQQQRLLDEICGLVPAPEFVLINTSPEHPLCFSPLAVAAPEAVVVVVPSRPAITEAYALIKKVSVGYARRHFRVLVNQVRHGPAALAIYENIARLTHSRGLAQVDYAGCLPMDERLRQAARLSQPVAALFPDSAAAKSLRELAGQMASWPLTTGDAGGLEHFVQQLLHFSQQLDSNVVYA